MDECRVEPVGQGIGMVRVPVPLPVKATNVYVLGDPPDVIVDCGTLHPTGLAVLMAAVRRPPRAIMVTHLHVDHCGAAGALQREWGCEVWMSEDDAEEGRRFYTGPSENDRVYWEMFLRYGMPEDGARATYAAVDRIRGLTDYPVVDRLLRDGDTIEAGGRQYVVLLTPGHTMGHLCLLEKDSGVLFAGDHILPRITPNVGLSTREGFNPIREYVASLRRVAALSPSVAYPGHGPVVDDPAGRARETVRHHVARARRMLDILSRKASSAYEVAVEVFGKDLDPFQQRFAVGETVAHLDWIVSEGWASRSDEDGVTIYSAARPGEIFEIPTGDEP
ncbi:MAG: MBL fold metallo-hydrolase [Ignavibacteriales bacterium]